MPAFAHGRRLALLTLAIAASTACSARGHESSGRVTQAVGADAAAGGPWTGTWAVSPQQCNTTFAQQTLRHIVHTSIAGSAARVQISNVFGSQPLTVSHVHIAAASSPTDSAIDPGSDQTVTFSGQNSATIAPGALVASDAVAFPVAALSDVAISIYFPQPTDSAATCHQTGLQTSYIASGNVGGSATLSGAQTTQSYYFLTNLDVQNSAAEGAVATLGASITDGIASSSDHNRRWPNDLAVRLANAGRTIGVLNQGISGNQLLVDGAGQSALHRFQRDVLSQPGIRWVTFSDDPVNDLGDSHPSGDQLIAGLKQLITMAHQSGVKILCATLTPFEGAGYWSSTEEVGRGAYDDFVRSANSGCDGVIDLDAATHDPANPTRYLPAYDSGDHLHPNEAGLQAMADALDLSLFGMQTPPGDDGGAADAGGDSAQGGGDGGGDTGSGSTSSSGSSASSSSSSGGGGTSSGGGSGSGASSSGGGSGTSSSGAPPPADGGDAFASPTSSSGGCSATGSASSTALGTGAIALGAFFAIGRRRRR
jgi:lysophospholipase L1-like esterase